MRLRRKTGWMLCGCIAMLQATSAFGDATLAERPTEETIVTTYSGLGVAELYILPDLPDGWSASVPAVLGVADGVTFPVDGSFDIQTDRSGGASIVGGYFTMAGPVMALIRPNGDVADLDDLGVTFTRSGRAAVTWGSLFGPRYGHPGLLLEWTSTDLSENGVLTLEAPLALESRYARHLGIGARGDVRIAHLRVVLDDLVVDPDGSDAIFDGGGSNDQPLAGAIGPDVYTSDIGSGLNKYGSIGGVTGYSFSTTSCNIGDEWAEWFSTTANHPLVAQDMYRINQQGDFEQIGMSWLKHTWCAADFFSCQAGGVNNGTCNWMTIGVADVYGAGLNGDQSDLGPRSEVNAAMGSYPYPYNLSWNATGNATFKRMQIHDSDLDPAQNPGVTYLAEGHYLTTDEAADFPNSDTQYNNATWRLINVGGFSNGWALSFSGSSHVFESAIEAWPQLVAGVNLEQVKVPDETGGAPDGKLIVGNRATSNGDGTWHYSYAVYNMNSDRSVGAFTVSLPDDGVGVTNVGFHDVDYHSGEPYALVDWQQTETSTSCRWQTMQSFAQNANANAIRWATTYSFQFDSDNPPYRSGVTLDLFKPGIPMTIAVSTLNPATDCDGNDVADQAEIDANGALDLNENGILDSCESLNGTMAATSARQLRVTLQGISDPFAMFLTGDSENPAISCVSGWIQSDGTLGVNPVTQTALQWGATLVEDPGIIPGALYRVIFDPPLLPDLVATTDLYCDVNDSGAVNLGDAFLVVLGFNDPGNSQFTVEQMDVDPACDGGNGVINLADVQRVVLTWQGTTWLQLCGPPCP